MLILPVRNWFNFFSDTDTSFVQNIANTQFSLVLLTSKTNSMRIVHIIVIDIVFGKKTALLIFCALRLIYSIHVYGQTELFTMILQLP